MMECARVAEGNAKRKFGRPNVAKERLSISRTFDKIKKNVTRPCDENTLKAAAYNRINTVYGYIHYPDSKI